MCVTVSIDKNVDITHKRGMWKKQKIKYIKDVSKYVEINQDSVQRIVTFPAKRSKYKFAGPTSVQKK